MRDELDKAKSRQGNILRDSDKDDSKNTDKSKDSEVSKM